MFAFIAIKPEFLLELNATLFGVVVFLLDQNAAFGCSENMDIDYASFQNDEIEFNFIFKPLKN